MLLSVRNVSVVGALLLLVAWAPQAGAQSHDSAALLRVPRAWASLGGALAPTDGSALNGGTSIGVQLGGGYRLSRHFGLEIDGLSTQLFGSRRRKHLCHEVVYVIVDGGSAATSCVADPPVDHVGGASASVDFIGSSIRRAPLVLSLGLGAYDITGKLTPNPYGPGAAAGMVRALGIRFGVDQVLAEGPGAALTLHVAPVYMPNVRRGDYWSVPIGVAFWGW